MGGKKRTNGTPPVRRRSEHRPSLRVVSRLRGSSPHPVSSERGLYVARSSVYYLSPLLPVECSLLPLHLELEAFYCGLSPDQHTPKVGIVSDPAHEESLVARAIPQLPMHTGAMSPGQQKSFMDKAALLDGADVHRALDILTLNSGMAVYQWNRTMGATTFVGFSFLDLALFFYCQRLYNRTPPESPRREHLKVAVWLLTTMLTFSAFMVLEFWFSGAKIS